MRERESFENKRAINLQKRVHELEDELQAMTVKRDVAINNIEMIKNFRDVLMKVIVEFGQLRPCR